MPTDLAVNEPQISAMSLLQSAVQQGAPIDTIERLAKLQREMVEYDAKVAFDQSMQRAQAKMRRIGVDATNPQTKSRYLTYAKLDQVLRPIYSEEGFAVSFNTADSVADMVRVIAYVSHQTGHTRTYQIDMPADGKGAKGGDVMTKTHATGAATSYGMRYLLKMIFNVAVGETDDDGNGAVGLGDTEQVSWLDTIDAAQNEDELVKYFNAAYTEAIRVKDKDALDLFKAARNKRRDQLRQGASV